MDTQEKQNLIQEQITYYDEEISAIQDQIKLLTEQYNGQLAGLQKKLEEAIFRKGIFEKA